jgi:hypothetical protein
MTKHEWRPEVSILSSSLTSVRVVAEFARIQDTTVLAAFGILANSATRLPQRPHSGSASVLGSGSQKLVITPTAYTTSATPPAA